MACEPRTWDDGKRCASCCNGDRCDDPDHYSRENCPHCKGTGWALWTEAGRADYLAYHMKRGATPEQAQAVLAKHGYGVPRRDEPDGECQYCRGAEFPGWKRGLRCPACNGTSNAGVDSSPTDQPKGGA